MAGRTRAGRWAAMVAGAMLAGALVGAPALADVKAGTDAWARGDWAKAVAEWRGPAIAGDPNAQFDMGQAYKLGRGVPTDPVQAEEWFRKAALQGHELAGDNYGLALFGDGRKAEALPWLEKSVARDERRAELVLGTMLFNGDGGAKDWVRAYALVSRSSQQGLSQAGQTLAQMDGYLSPEQRQQGTALAAQIASRAKSAQVASLPGPAAARPAGPQGPAAGTIARADLPPSQAPGPAPRSFGTAAPLPDQPGPAEHPKHIPAHERAELAERGEHPDQAEHPEHPRPEQATRPERPDRAGHPAPAGRWHVQLGAFRDAGNAKALWSRVGGRVGGQPNYVAGGGVTRLQAGPFATRADAERACRAAAAPCTVLP